MPPEPRVMSSGDARSQFRAVLAAAENGFHTTIERHGAPTAVVVPTEWYARAVEALGKDQK